MEKGSSITSVLFKREFLSVFIVVVNAFSWYFPLYIFFENTLGNFQMDPNLLLTAFGVQFVATIGFAIVGTALKKSQGRDTILAVWMFAGIIASILMVTLETFNMTSILLLSVLLGFSLGFGFPSCLSYFGDYSTVENRGWLAGITFLASGLGILLIGLITSFSTLVASALIFAAWRGIGLILFLFSRTKQDYDKEKTVEVSYKSVLLDRSFLLYLVPWIMFFLINFLEAPVIDNFLREDFTLLGEDFTVLIPIAEYGIGGFVALIAGRFADSVGRKRIVILGFIMLGIGYGLIGLFPFSSISWYLYIIVDGIAWGILLPMFYLVICSELAGNRNKEKYCLIGLVPFLIGSYIRILFTPFAELFEVWTAFSLASIFLFIATLPLIYAPETMPQKHIELKRLRKFADEAKKAKEKYERKMSD